MNDTAENAQTYQANRTKSRLTVDERKAAIEARLEKQRAKLRTAQQALRAIENAEQKKARKAETRQKIIIGATFMKVFGVANEVEAQPLFDLIISSQIPDKLRERIVGNR